MTRMRQDRVKVAARYSQIVIGSGPAMKPNIDSSIGRLAGVIELDGVVYCRWEAGSGRFLITTSFSRGTGRELVAKHSANEDIVLLGIREDGTQILNLISQGSPPSGINDQRKKGTH